jgi:hypothetical protein
MTLSMEKLETFLSKHGMVSKNFFVDSKMRCIYIEVLTLKHTESFMLYIPSKYSIQVEHGTNVFIIHSHDVSDNGDIIDSYADGSKMKETESKYSEVNVKNYMSGKYNVEQSVEESYNRPIFLSSKTENNRDIFRQLRRLGRCLQSTKYKLLITTSSFLYCITRDNKINLYNVELHEELKHKLRKIFVSVDLEMLYDQIKTMPEHVKEIKEGITSVLLTNFSKHMNSASTLLADTKLIEQRNTSITSKQLEYIKRTGEVEKMLNDVVENEKKLLVKKSEVDEKLSLRATRGLNRDVEFVKLVRPIELKLNELNETKKDLIRNLVSLKMKHDNLLLVADSFSFDILVMLQTVNQKLQHEMEI